MKEHPIARPPGSLLLPIIACGLLHGAEDPATTPPIGPGDTGTAHAVPTEPPPVTITRVPPSSGWDLDTIAGLRFGGIIGGSVDNALTCDTRTAVIPEADADVGVAGTKVALGARWRLGESHWLLSGQGLHLDYESQTAISPRLIACYRWESRHRRPSLWHGIAADRGWYLGCEVGVCVQNVAFDIAVTWRAEDRAQGPMFTLGYGFGF